MDIDSNKTYRNSKLAKGFIENTTKILEKISDGATPEQIAEMVREMFYVKK